jgi:nucleotidyltransferase substrate binding protein (TIGR01987 family)
MSKEIRWKQRAENLSKAFALFQEAATAQGLSRLEKEGLIQRFEYTFELAWKTLKDYLEAQGISASFPRDVIKEAFRAGVIEDGETWLEMLDKRNQLSHTYDETKFNDSVEAVQLRFYKPLAWLVDTLRKEQ